MVTVVVFKLNPVTAHVGKVTLGRAQADFDSCQFLISGMKLKREKKKCENEAS